MLDYSTLHLNGYRAELESYNGAINLLIDYTDCGVLECTSKQILHWKDDPKGRAAASRALNLVNAIARYINTGGSLLSVQLILSKVEDAIGYDACSYFVDLIHCGTFDDSQIIQILATNDGHFLKVVEGEYTEAMPALEAFNILDIPVP